MLSLIFTLEIASSSFSPANFLSVNSSPKMVIEVNKKPGYETVATYDNWEDAEKKMQELQYNDEENNEYYIK